MKLCVAVGDKYVFVDVEREPEGFTFIYDKFKIYGKSLDECNKLFNSLVLIHTHN
jgi:hypothetical protein